MFWLDIRNASGSESLYRYFTRFARFMTSILRDLFEALNVSKL